jgi:hypothetical protein
MGMSVYPRLVIGATLCPTDLMTEIPGAIVCPKGHPPDKSGAGPFCSTCGTKQTPQWVRSYKLDFVKFAQKMHNKTPDELFDEWNSDDATGNLQFHIVNPVSNSEDFDPNYVLGYRLLEYECTEYRGKGLYSVDLAQLEQIKRNLFEIICDLDYTSRDIKLYLCTHVSC